MRLQAGDKGPDVVALQEDLTALGYRLTKSTRPDGSLDGSLGSETLDAVNRALRLPEYHDVDPTSVDDDERSYIRALRQLTAQDAPKPTVIGNNLEAAAFDPAKFQASMTDLRRHHAPTVSRKIDGKIVVQSYVPAMRPWSEFTGITYHQTACDMGETDTRYYGIGAHFVVLRSGRVLWMCDPDRIVYHGNGWNSRCVGIEVNGLYPGLADDPSTIVDEALRTTWDNPATSAREKPMPVTTTAAIALRNLTRWLKWHGEKNGASVRFLVAHRQSSMDRRNDPGETLWRQCAVPLHAELGLSDGGVGFKIGGYPIPRQWDPRCAGFEY